MIRILIIDDHAMVREGLEAILGREADFRIIGLGGSVGEALSLAKELQPDIILMDYLLPDGTGVDATRQILAQNPTSKVIFLSLYSDDERLLAAIRSGAKGYLLKDLPTGKLIEGIRQVYQGESALSPAMTLRLMQELARSEPPSASDDSALAKLTGREKEVLRAVAGGMTNQEIAQVLFVSENTVKYHMHSILEKLNIPDRKSAAQYARQHGLG